MCGLPYFGGLHPNLDVTNWFAMRNLRRQEQLPTEQKKKNTLLRI